MLNAGYWIRTQGISHAFTYRAELGTRIPVPILGRLWWTARLTGIESFASADDIASAAGNLGGLGQGVTFTSIGFDIGDAFISIGLVIDAAIRFVVVAFILFLMIKAYNNWKGPDEETA